MQYRLLNGKEVIDLTEEEEEAVPIDSHPRAGSSEITPVSPSELTATPPANEPQRGTNPENTAPLAQARSPSAGIHPQVSTIVGLALLVDGGNGLDRAKLCKETGLSRQQLTDLIKPKGSVWRGMVAAAHSLG